MTIMRGKQRVIRPELNSLPRYTRLSHVAFRLLIGVIQHADDAGNMDCNSDVVAHVLRLEEQDVRRAFSELCAAGILVPYTFEGLAYAEVVGWNVPGHELHQSVHKRYKSTWRNPPRNSDSNQESKDGKRDPVRRVNHDDGRGNLTRTGGTNPRRDDRQGDVRQEAGVPLRREAAHQLAGTHRTRSRKASDHNRGTPLVKHTEKPVEALALATPKPTTKRTVRGGRFDPEAFRAKEAQKLHKSKQAAPFKGVVEQHEKLQMNVIGWMGRLHDEKDRDKRRELAKEALTHYPRVSKFIQIVDGTFNFGEDEED